jgi:glycosyltransferase involved in cell wall biosynthesis
MNVLYSNPPWWIENPEGIYTPKLLAGVRAGSRWPFTTAVRSRPGQYQFGDYLPYPFFLGAAATYLARATGATVAFRDSLALREGYPAYFDYLKEQDFDYIFIESASPSWDHDAGLIGEIKRRFPRTRLVLTGPIASRGEALLAEHPLHAVIQGEYEKGSVAVINGAEGLIPYDLLTEAELNAAPYPYYDAQIAHRYWDANPRGQRPPQAQVLSSRGCPFKCIFCVWPAVMTGNDPDGTGTRLVRQYGADYMEGFLTDIVGRFGYRTIYFDDDTFNLGDRHVREMCGVMTRIGLPWAAMCRADTISRDTWRLMRQSGCFGVKLGFESGNQWVVDNIVRKNLDLEQAREVVLHLKSLGFTVHGTFTVGLPGETPEQMADTEGYRRSLPLDTFQQSGTAEIEGSPLATLRRQGRLEKYAGAHLDGYVGENDGTRKLRRVALGGTTLTQARLCRDQGQPALAEAICRNLLEAGGEDASVLDLLGQLAAEVRMFDVAVRYFSRAIKADPNHGEACRHLGDLLAGQGLVEEAAACYRQALAGRPDDDQAKLALDRLAAAPRPDLSPDQPDRPDLAVVLAARPHTPWGRNMKNELLDTPGTDPAATSPAPAESPLEEPSLTAARLAAGPRASGDDGAGPRPDAGAARLVVLDHGLRFAAGHHFAYALGLLTECLARQIPLDIYAHADCRPEVAKVLGARAVLQPTQYVAHSSDKYCGYLEDFLIASKLTEFNLFKNLKGKVRPTDLVYVHTADPKIVMGIAAWYVSMTEDKRPYLCLKFQNHGYRYVMKNYKALVQSVFRLALKPFIRLDKVSFACSNKLIGAQIELLAEKPCPVFPVPLQLGLPPRPYRSRRDKGTIFIGYAGEGRDEQGVNLLPDVIAAILPAHPDVRFVIQLGCPFAEKETLARLRAFGDRVTLLEQCYVGGDFHQLLASFDLLLLPYSPDRYIERSSQIVIEAISLGLPLVVPKRTSLAFEAREFDCGHAVMEGYWAGAVVAAIESFLADHDAQSRKSAQAAPVCAAFHSGKTLVDKLLALCHA